MREGVVCAPAPTKLTTGRPIPAACSLAVPAMPITMIIFAISILIGRGSAVLYSIELGRKNYAEAQKLFGMSIFL